MIPTFMHAARNGDTSDAAVFADWLEEHGDPRAAPARAVATLSAGKARRLLLRLFPLWKKDALMGCDIHCYVEYRVKNPRGEWEQRWSDFGGRINPGRNYTLFAALAGVRGGGAVVQPRGLPDDIGYAASRDGWLCISEDDPEAEGHASPEAAARWHANGHAYRLDGDGKPLFVAHPDWHTPTWLTPDEWAAALKKARATPKSEPEYHALLAALRALEQAGYVARVVLWFDN